jgi:GT2 family glycosyltransferase
VVIPTFERAAQLSGLIAALEAQTIAPGDFDVIVADDASRDETQAVLADLAARTRLDLRVVRNPSNSGPAKARNLAWRSSDAPIIAFTDDDCLPDPRWLEAGLDRLENTSVGIVQGRTLPDPSIPDKGWAKTVRIERFSKKYETCNIFYRRAVLEEVGGFDEEIIIPFGEDVVPGWQARRLGITAEFAPEALVYHAVTYPGLRYWWRFASFHANWASLVRRFPEMRRDMLWANVFLARRHAALLVGIVGAVVGGTVWLPALLLAVPYLSLVAPRRFRRRDFISLFASIAFDAAVIAGMLRGSLRERALVL